MTTSTSPRLPLLFLSTLWLACCVRAACRGRQSYVLSVQMNYTRNIDPTLPEKARIPLLVAVVHKPSFVLFKIGDELTDEVAEVAKQFRFDQLVTRLQRLRDSGSVSSFSFVEGIPIDDVTRMEVTAEDDASLVSIMAPLVPSPAWFIGIQSQNLCDGEVFVPEADGLELVNFNSGLLKGTTLEADIEEYPEGEAAPVGIAGALGDKTFAQLSLEQGTLGVDWWKIFLGVLVAVAVIFVLIIFVYPRCRKRRPADIPLTAPDGVQW